MGNIITGIHPTRIETVDDHRILIFDNLFSRKEIVRLHEVMSLSNFTFLHSSRFDTKKYREWMADFSIEDFEKHVLHEKAKSVAEQFANHDRALQCYNVFCNASTYGNQSFIHSDSYDKTNISVLYYVNANWKSDWGGETIFFDKNQEARVAIGFKPGRMIVFDAETVHRAGLPSRICPEVRLTLSVRFQNAL